MLNDESKLKSIGQFILLNSAVAMVYFWLGRVGLHWAGPLGLATPLWIPSGISLLAILFWGPQVLVGVFIGAFAVNFSHQPLHWLALFTNWHVLLIDLFIAIGSSLQPYVGWLLFKSGRNFSTMFDRLRDTSRFVLIAAVMCIISSSVAVLGLYLFQKGVEASSLRLTWITWWLGDLFGILLVVPLGLVWRRLSPVYWTRQSLFEALIVLLLTIAVSVFTFHFDYTFSRSFFVFPLLIWAATRFGQLGATVISSVIVTLAVVGTIQGIGPFILADDPHLSLVMCQVFSGVVIMSGLLIAAVNKEWELAELELTKLAGIISTSEDSFAVCDLTGVVTHWNEGAERLFGYSRKEMIGQQVKILYPPEKLAEGEELIRRVNRGERVAPFETIRRCKDGTLIPILLTVCPVYDSLGRRVAGAGIARDVRAFKKTEEELRKAKELSDAANQAKSYFLSNMSHEIRTPINAIMGYSDLLSHSTVTDDEKDEYLKKISQNSRYLLELINSVLDLSKIEAGELKLQHSVFSLREHMDSVKEFFEPQLRKKKIFLNISSDPDVPEMIESDRTRLKQVLLNVIGNSIKFTMSGGVTVHIGRDRRNDTGLSITVTDTGPGIALEKKQELFKPFSQCFDPSMSQKYRGTGLGLVLSRKLAQALGGSLNLKWSELGVGTAFEIQVPWGQIEQSYWPRKDFHSEDDGNPVFDERTSTLSLSGKHILLVEDNDDNREIIRKFLENAGGTVSEARNGIEAEELALSSNFDVILMDIGLPILSGYEVVSRLRAKGYNRVILALTAHALREEKTRCLKVGCDDFLSKPISESDLISAVYNWASTPS